MLFFKAALALVKAMEESSLHSASIISYMTPLYPLLDLPYTEMRCLITMLNLVISKLQEDQQHRDFGLPQKDYKMFFYCLSEKA